MTLSPRETWTRRLAIRISRGIVRWASPGCKEWAEGLAREVEHIESDWSALLWAIGSMRVLLDYREAPIASLEKVPELAEKYVEEARGYGYVVLAMSLLGFLSYLIRLFFNNNSWKHPDGELIFAFGVLVGMAYTVISRWRLKDPVNDYIYYDVEECARFYKAELEQNKWYLWMPVVCWWCCYAGVIAGTNGSSTRTDTHRAGEMIVLLVLVALFEAVVVMGKVRANRRRVERIEELMRGRG